MFFSIRLDETMQPNGLTALGMGCSRSGAQWELRCRCLGDIDLDGMPVAHPNGREDLENESPNQRAECDQHDRGELRKLKQPIGRNRN